MKRLASLITVVMLLTFQGNSQEFIGGFEKPAKDKSGTCIDQWFKVKEVSIYGGGSLMSLVTAEDLSDESTSTSGSLGLNFNTKRIWANLFFSYNGKKTIEMYNLEQFGNSLMNPNYAGESVAFSMLAHVKRFAGLSIRFDASDNIWQLDSITMFDASPIIFRGGFFIRPFNFNMDSNENKIDFILKFHYTHRGVLGDFNNDPHIIDGIEIPPRGYNGFEISANFFFNYLELFFQYSNNAKGDFINLPGFTGSQVTIGLNITGKVITLKNQ
jgi:hypothetical protein